MLRLATREAAAGLITEAEAAAEVKDADEGKEFGRGCGMLPPMHAEPCSKSSLAHMCTLVQHLD